LNGLKNGCQNGKTIRKPDFFVRFSNGFNKMAAKAIQKLDPNFVRKMTI
jgi:hypothetical protein